MAKIGRNDSCPCGSGRKFKRCCDGKLADTRYTREDRAAAIEALTNYTMKALVDEDDAAYMEIHDSALEHWDEVAKEWDQISDAYVDAWFWFDRPLDDGRSPAERFLAVDPGLPPGQQRYLRQAITSCVRLYEVVDTLPGTSVTLREIIGGRLLTVNERTASRTLTRDDLFAARVVQAGASGGPEMDMGVLLFSSFARAPLVAEVRAVWEEFCKGRLPDSDVDFWKIAASLIHRMWVSFLLDPPIPQMANTDGDPVLVTRVHYLVGNAARATAALDALPRVDRSLDRLDCWIWSGENPEGKSVILGTLTLSDATLILETNSANRATRGQALIEGPCGDSIEYRTTEHEDPTKALKDAMRTGGRGHTRRNDEEEVPREIQEDLVLDMLGKHYRTWPDIGVPALGGKTPREGARDPALRSATEDLIRGLEGMYHRALQTGEPAYDPSWMWEELGLVDATAPLRPPPLHHERMERFIPGFAACTRGLAARLRGPTGSVSGVFEPDQLEQDLELRRFERAAHEASPSASPAELAARGPELLRRHLAAAINFEVHRRKIFWVDASLAFQLCHTEFDIVGRELRLPFDSFVLVFTDRQVLSFAARMLARDPACPVRGAYLRVATVYVSEANALPTRSLRLLFAFDAGGADPPYLFEHHVPLADEARVELPTSGAETQVILDGETVKAPLRPFPALVQVAINAVLYATSAGVDAQTVPANSQERHEPRDSAPTVTSEEVYHLPGTISISRLRPLQELDRLPSGRQLISRFMVRGHWRRAPAGWTDRRMRWIEPYWKGPELAAVVERAYRLKP